MNDQPVHWHEGQFLRPHHFQQSVRSLEALVERTSFWTNPFAYGVRTAVVDLDALGNWRVKFNRCHVRLRDGTPIRAPEDCSLAEVAIEREAFSGSRSNVVVYVGVPILDMGRANTGAAGSAGVYRHVVEIAEVEDENMSGNSQRVQVRRPHAKILIGHDATEGYDAIPIVRLRLGTSDEGTPEIDPSYIPPVMTVSSWRPFLDDYLRPIFDRLSEVSKRLGLQMKRKGMVFEPGRPEDVDKILLLQAVNSVLGGLAYIANVGQVPPLTAYVELCRAVGTLSFFKAERHMPDLPPYEHEDLGGVFAELSRLLELDIEVKRPYVARSFKGEGFQMQVKLDKEWLQPNWKFYIGVKSKLGLQDVDRLLRTQLDLKAGAADEVDSIYRRATAGVHLNPAPNPPRDFPLADWSYWLVNRDSPAWNRVQETLEFGIRFNEQQAKGKIDGAEEVVVEKPDDSSLVSIAFTLYATKTNT
ncbi:MAG: type VI secretion system baseplate subunit TssK [Planctomycetaceae bacterium]|nr:type VI secretion system baseplate subunit TssK [Planctomycetaceae bacterium]